MCIIVIKHAGTAAPTKRVLQNCFENNPDGAGFMLCDPATKTIELHKGLMNFKTFWEAYKTYPETTDNAIVYHFRIATHGEINQGHTHPFPLTDNEKLLRATRTTIRDNVGIAHNGIIPNYPEKSESDTIRFIRTIAGLQKKIMKQDFSVFELIELAARNSKLAFLYPDGDIVTTGTGWHEDKKTGILYSNTSYEERRFSYWGRDKKGRFLASPQDNFAYGCYPYQQTDYPSNPKGYAPTYTAPPYNKKGATKTKAPEIKAGTPVITTAQRQEITLQTAQLLDEAHSRAMAEDARTRSIIADYNRKYREDTSDPFLVEDDGAVLDASTLSEIDIIECPTCKGVMQPYIDGYYCGACGHKEQY